MNLERIYQLRDEGKISTDEAMQLAEAVQRQNSAAQPDPGIISSWITIIAGSVAVAALVEYRYKSDSLTLFGTSPLLRAWFGCVFAGLALGAWIVCRRTTLYASSPALRGRAAAGLALGGAVLVLRLPQLFLLMFA